MKDYIVKIELNIEAENELEAQGYFWDRINDTDYNIIPEIIEEN